MGNVVTVKRVTSGRHDGADVAQMLRYPAKDVVFELVDNDVFRGIQNRRGTIRLIVHVALKPAQDFPFLGGRRV